MNFLDGGRAWWDFSARMVHFKRVDDRDFYLGRFVGDAALNDTTCSVNLNEDPPYDLDLIRDPYTTVPVGTQVRFFFPFGSTTNQVPPTPWPFHWPGFLSPM